MGIEPAIDITAEQRETVLSLLERHLSNTTAWVYGSRAKWTARPQSDLDMVVFTTPEQNSRVFELREAFEESNLPFRVDLFVWDDVPERFRKHIEQDYVVLMERDRSMGSGWKTITLGEFAPLQRAIAHILGSLDDKIELNRRMNETLEEMARAIFKDWFVDFGPTRAKMEGRDTGLPPEVAALFPDRLVESELGEMPEGWGVGVLDDAIELLSGGTPRTSVASYWDGRKYIRLPRMKRLQNIGIKITRLG